MALTKKTLGEMSAAQQNLSSRQSRLRTFKQKATSGSYYCLGVDFNHKSLEAVIAILEANLNQAITAAEARVVVAAQALLESTEGPTT